MSEPFKLHEVSRYVAGQDRIPGSVVLSALADNNTELKILIQASLRENEPVPLKGIQDTLIRACNGNVLQTVSYPQVYSTVKGMDDNFVSIKKTPEGTAVMQTKAGRNLSAAVGGHILNLAKETNTSARVLVGENLQPRLLYGGQRGRGSVDARLIVLSTMWEHAKEDWQSSIDLMKMFVEKGVSVKQAEAHLKRLQQAGIVEQSEPSSKTKRDPGVRRYKYRLKQKNAEISPTKIVERYLSIVLLSSVIDPDFIAEGLDHLGEISNDPTYVPYLLKRSYANTKHTGKGYSKPSQQIDHLL